MAVTVCCVDRYEDAVQVARVVLYCHCGRARYVTRERCHWCHCPNHFYRILVHRDILLTLFRREDLYFTPTRCAVGNREVIGDFVYGTIIRFSINRGLSRRYYM